MYPISVFDSSLTLKGIIDDYEYLKFNFRYRTVDNFTLKINRYKNNTDYLIKGAIIATYINGKYRAGIIESKDLSLNDKGKISEVYTINGRGLDGLMANRIALYATDSGTGYDSQNGKAETIMKHYVDVNCVSSAIASRNYSLLEIETDTALGDTILYEARFQYLHDILEEISLVSNLGWDIWLDVPNKKFKFKVYAGVDRSWNNGVNSPVVFSPENGNIKLVGYYESLLNSKNVAYVGGQGEANLRDVDEVAKDAGTYTDLNRREIFIDARDLDTTAKMLVRGNEKLAELGEENSIEIENINTEYYRFGYEYDVGDIVTIKYPDIIEVDARILEVALEITPNDGLTNKIIIGREFPDLISYIKQNNSNISPEIRR